MQLTYYKGNTEIASRLIQVDQMGQWEDSVNKPPDLAEGDKVTALQYINEASKSDVVEWIFPPVAPEIDEIHVGENVHSTGKGIPNYWIHQHHKRVSGGEDYDTFSIKEDGTWRALNYFPVLEVGDTVRVTQSKHEFDEEDKRSKSVSTIVK